MDIKDRSPMEESRDPLELGALLGGVWREFLKTWLLGLVLAAAFCAVGLVQSWRNYVPQYEASASFIVSLENNTSSIYTSQYYNQITTKQLSATFPYIMTSGALNRVVARDLGMSYVPGTISAKMLGETNLFQISVVSSDPQNAYDVLQSVVKNYPSVAEYVIGNTQLKPLESAVVPTQPTNPFTWQGTALRWAAIGLGLYAAILVVLAINRRTIKNKRDLQRFLNLNYLGGVPQVRLKRRSKERAGNVLVASNAPETYTESMEKVQVRLHTLMKRKGWKTLFVTSSTMGEGKTTTSCNLALTLANKGAKVLLIDGDLRNPSVADALGCPEWKKSGGLRDFLSGRKEAGALLRQYKKTSLLVMPGGTATNHVAELMSTGRLEKLIQQCRDQVDYIIIDTPPCTAMHDTTIIAAMVEAGILVVRQDYAPVGRIITAAEIMTQVGANLCGCLINGEMGSIGGYGYGKYGYSKYGYGRSGYAGYSRYGHQRSKTARVGTK